MTNEHVGDTIYDIRICV